MRIRHAFFATLLAATPCMFAAAQTVPAFPSRTLNIVVPVGPGGSYDYLGRLLGDALSGKVRAIVTAGETRELPEVPTARESGLPELVLSSWTGLFVPATTPRPVVMRLRQAIDNIVSTPAFREHLASRSFSTFTTADVEAFVRTEIQRWPPLLARSGIKPP